MSQHTPGPWTIDGETQRCTLPIRAGNQFIASVNVRMPRMRKTPHNAEVRAEDFANARLIAAAPALFDLALSMVTWQGVPKTLKDEAAALVADIRADGKAVPS